MGKFVIILGCIAVVLLIGLSVVVWGIGVNNSAIDLEVRFKALTGARETTLDTMWKTLEGKYQIKGDYEKTFKDAIVATVEGRKGGDLLKFVTEATGSGPDSSIYKEMMATIEGQRATLKRSQDTMLDVVAQHDNLRIKFPTSIIVGSRTPLEVKLITSTKTQNIITLGKEDDIKLGGSK